MLGGATMTFGALFRTIATAAGAPPGAELSPAQRLRAIAVAIETSRQRLGPLRRSASRPGFARAFERLLDELQAAGIEPDAVQASAATLEGSAYLSDIATLYGAYAAARERSGRIDAHGIAREAIELRTPTLLGRAPVFLYGLDRRRALGVGHRRPDRAGVRRRVVAAPAGSTAASPAGTWSSTCSTTWRCSTRCRCRPSSSSPTASGPRWSKQVNRLSPRATTATGSTSSRAARRASSNTARTAACSATAIASVRSRSCATSRARRRSSPPRRCNCARSVATTSCPPSPARRRPGPPGTRRRSLAGGRHNLDRGRDLLVHPEEVGRVVGAS